MRGMGFKGALTAAALALHGGVAQGAEPARISAVILLDEVPASALRAAEGVGPAWAQGLPRPQPIPLTSLPALSRLRWAEPVAAGRAGAAAQGDPTLCGLNPDALEERLKAADDELLFGDDQDALGLVLKVEAALACAAEPADRDLLARAWLMEGIARDKLDLATSLAFRRAATVWPEPSLASEYSPDAQAAFKKATQEVAARPPVTVTLDAGLLGDRILWIDGQLWNGDRATVAAGEHFLQVVAPGGALVAGAWVEAKEGGDARWPAPPLRPVAVEAIEDALVLEMGASGPGEWQRRIGADPDLAGGWVVWASHDPLTDQTRLRWVSPGGEVFSSTLRPQSPAGERSHRRLPIVAGALGATAAASLGAYAYLYHDVANTPHTSEEIASLRRLGLIAEGAGVGTGAAAIVVAGVAFVPRLLGGGGGVALHPQLTVAPEGDDHRLASWTLSLGGTF